MLSASQRASAADLLELVEHLLTNHCECVGIVSRKICEEIIEHHERDLKRLKILHPAGVHPAKHIGYLVFWVRKLKPVSNAFHASTILAYKNADIPYDEEFATINELVAIYLAQHLLLSYTIDGYMVPDCNPVQRNQMRGRVEEILKSVLSSPLDAGHTEANMFAAFVYDMRYRTFGPHHIVHFINHVVYAAVKRDTL